MGDAGCEQPEQPVNDGREELNIQSVGNLDPPRRLVKDTESCPLSNPESEAITCKQVMNVDASAQPTRRILPSSLMGNFSRSVFKPSFGNYKRPLIDPMRRGFRKSGGSKLTANVKDVPKGSSDNNAGSQISEKRKIHFSMQPDFDCMVKMKGEIDTSKHGGRVLRSSFVGGNSIDTLTRFQPPVFEKSHTKLKPSVESIDSKHLHGSDISYRLLPSSFHGRSANIMQQPGTSNGQKNLGMGDDRHIHDERHIYQEALQNLDQPKFEDDLPDTLLAVPLLKHQKIALAWMVQKENSVHCTGGILADDQGLGKTVSMIALIQKQMTEQLKFTSANSSCIMPETLNLDEDEDGVSYSAKSKQQTERMTNSRAHSSSQNSKSAGGTLVVCPASVLRQWAQELDEKVPESAKLSVLIYHGGARTKDPMELTEYHVVLTTYSIVTREVPTHLLAADDEKDQLTCNKKRKAVPKKGNKQKRKGKRKKNLQHDLGSGPLARVRWFRIILDEAQIIKNHRTQVSRSCSGLHAKRRWCLSGTPMQNSIDDLYSYFCFLKYDPYADYSSFCASIKYPISTNASSGYKKLRAVFKAILLRRTKGTLINGEPILNLPPKSIFLEKLDFSQEERQFYLQLEAESRQQFKEYANAGTLKQNYANILLLLLRLRQACDHPILVKGFHSDTSGKNSLPMEQHLPRKMIIHLLNQLESSLGICDLCSDLAEDAVVTMCGHVFCYQCVSEHLTGDDNLCPATDCSNIIGSDSFFSQDTLKSYISDDNTDLASTSYTCDPESITRGHYISSKIKAALDILMSISGSNTKVVDNLANSINFKPNQLNLNPKVPEKVLIFSQWTGMLDLLELSLDKYFIQYRRLDGTMSLTSRDKAVKDFNNDPEVTAMLMSLKAGSLGLNMVAARHVILLDLWWNPTTEEQAIDRVHRIGQTHPVKVSRITIKDTVEDRILALQEKKRKMISSAFGDDHGGNKASQLSVEDLKYLFNFFND
ncbi:helicase-like transcription factor CHR28 [Curcuma longa]|uniref:helicase-like transcription factor CHR28 n=1 Tax=Curcuma longa TaxID=136217 RepID=UPI003D9EFC42